MDRDLARMQRRELICVVIHADHVVPELGEASRGYQANVSRTYDPDLHTLDYNEESSVPRWKYVSIHAPIKNGGVITGKIDPLMPIVLLQVFAQVRIILHRVVHAEVVH